MTLGRNILKYQIVIAATRLAKVSNSRLDCDYSPQLQILEIFVLPKLSDSIASQKSISYSIK